MTDTDYIISIPKEKLADMPVTAYPGEITLVDTEDAANSAIRELKQQSAVGFDTETKPSFRKGCRHKVALMQISTATHCWLFRINKTGITDSLKNFLENPHILKIGLSVHDDFAAIRRRCEFEPQGFVDLQETVRHFEIADISLQKIYAIIFGERISKSQRLTNWEAPELTPAQQIYAAIDAWACLKIYTYLRDNNFDWQHSPYRHHYMPPEKTQQPALQHTAMEENKPKDKKNKTRRRRRGKRNKVSRQTEITSATAEQQ